VRRPRRHPVLRSPAHRRPARSVARCRRDPRLGPTQPLLFSDAQLARRALWLPASTRRSTNCPTTCGRSSSTVPGAKQVPFSYLNERGRLPSVRQHAFEGIVVNLERRYKETDSLAVREELARLISNQTCPACHGSRLREEARNVRVGSKDERAHAARDQSAAARRRARLLPRPAASRQQGAGGRKGAQGNRQPAAVPDQRRPRLPVARPLGGDAFRRRGAAHPAGFADRLRADRRDVRPRRTVDRSASARQRAPAADAAAAARHRQYGDRRRTRRGSHPQRRLRRRYRPRRRRPWRLHRRRRPAGSDHRQPGLADRRLSRRTPAHRPACGKRRPARSGAPAADCRRARQQPPERHRRDPGRPVDLHHRRLRFGQVDPDQRHAVHWRRPGISTARQRTRRA
jgi:hypothetical protein